jgi:hypothetical protein
MSEQVNVGMDETYEGDPKHDCSARAWSHTRRSTSLYVSNKDKGGTLDSVWSLKETFEFRDG